MSVSRETIASLDRLGVSRETVSRLSAFVSLLGVWNQRINLVAYCDGETVWRRHVLDSLQLLPLLPFNIDRAADLGSGGGFPGLMVSIATGVHFSLIEADHRKAAFLREAARITGASVDVVATQIERSAIFKVPLITARALSPLPNLLALAYPFMGGCSTCLFLKGARAEQEIRSAAQAWTMKVERFTSLTDPAGVVLRISEVARAQ